jgi:hypothetical protein
VSNGLAFYSAYWGPKKSHCRHPYLRKLFPFLTILFFRFSEKKYYHAGE